MDFLADGLVELGRVRGSTTSPVTSNSRVGPPSLWVVISGTADLPFGRH
jgi:hypothetical protein